MTQSTTTSPPRQAARRHRLAARDLGRVVAVQEPRGTTSLVRIAHGHATCDCAEFRLARQPCWHIAAAARLLRGAA